MKITLQTIALLLLACTLACAGCKKDDPSSADILTGATCWKVVLLEGYDTANNLWVAVPVDDCDADNCIAFKSDQSYTVDEGAAKCDPGDPQTATGTWSISDDGKKLSFTDDSSTDVGTIVELTSSKLVYEVAIDTEKARFTLQAN